MTQENTLPTDRGNFNPELVTYRRFSTKGGKHAYSVEYDGNRVGLIGRPSQGFGNPWMGFLFSGENRIASGSGADIETVQIATTKIVGAKFADLTGPPVLAQAPKTEATPEPATANASAQSVETATQTRPKADPRPAPAKPEADPTFCLCNCGLPTKPKSKFRQGHDARVKGMLSRAKKSLEPGYEPKPNADGLELPAILVERARADASLAVAGFDAAEILSLAEKVGTL